MIIRKSFKGNESPTLYIVGTPIGNLDDITIRAINTLKNVDIIACEDKRISSKLLHKHNINKPMVSYHKFNEKERALEIILELKNNKNIALISDAGMPLISDPGNILLQEVEKENFNIVVVPGPSAFLNALVQSGFSFQRFRFNGFIPKGKTKKENLFKEILQTTHLEIFYESPNRIKQTLEIIQKISSSHEIFIAKELTKINETTIKGKVDEILKKIDKINLKGEFVLIIQKAKKKRINTPILLKEIEDLILNENKTRKEAIEIVATRNEISKNKLYNKVHDSNKN